jgi:hypothetical protein
MMEFFKKLSLILLAPPVITLFYDLIYGWFVKANFEIRKLKVWWHDMSPDSLTTAKTFLGSVTSPSAAEKFFNWPAPFALAMPALFFYLLYRIIFLIQGGKQGGYKSRH